MSMHVDKKFDIMNLLMSTVAQKKAIKIMVFGTFDGLHLGHLNFFWQARKLASHSCLIVSIARDKNVKKIKKRLPEYTETKRKHFVESLGVADEVVLGDLENYLKHIKKVNPDIIALGYDQKAYTENLEKDFKKNNLKIKIVRLKPYKEKIYKNSLLKNKNIYFTSRKRREINRPDSKTVPKT